MKTDDRPFGEGKQKWVTTEWLENNMDKDWVIMDTQPDVHDYFMAHIPGAVYFAQKLMRAPKNGLPAQMIPPKQASYLFGRIGIDNDTPVLIYTAKGGFREWGDGLEQCFMAYNLMRYNHSEVYLLDGGLDKWMDEGRETSQEFPEVEEKEFTPDVQKDMFLTYDQFLEVKDHDDTCLLDARPLSMYTGESGPWIKNGHIPGAVNLPWASLMQSNPKLLKPAEKIKKMAEVVGATKDKLIICSCGTGREATNEYTIFKHLLGYPKVKVYEGSFTEWTSYPDNQVVKGKEPR